MLILFTLLACDAERECSTLPPSQERDVCWHDTLRSLPAEQAARALEIAPQIEDPIYRGAAVYAWISAHAAAVDREQGLALCAQIEGTERGLCERRLQSAHLLR